MKIKMTLLLLCCWSIGADAQIPINIEKVIGSAFTITDAIIGDVVLTPAYKVNSYYLRKAYLGYGSLSVDTRQKMKLDLFGYPTYSTKTILPALKQVTESQAAFPINSLNKFNQNCKQPPNALWPNPYIVKVETHTERVWIDHVEATGLWPHDGPWTVWLKTAGARASCNNPAPTIPNNYHYWMDAEVTRSGSTVVALGQPNCVLNYPFYLVKDYWK